MSNRFPPLLEGEYYHIYNRGNNRDKIFFNEDNYQFFLKKLKQIILPFAYLYSYSLLPNHFHLFIRIKSSTEFPPIKTKDKSSEFIVSNQFRKFFISYAMVINKQESRTGSLFQKNFRRKQILNNSYFSYLIFYIHSNAEKHRLIRDFRDYPFSSFYIIGREKNTFLQKKEILTWFGNINNFYKFHDINRSLIQIEKLAELVKL